MQGEQRVETVVDVSRDLLRIPDRADEGEVVDELPSGADWRFEPDWDGLRVTARLGPGAARLVSERQRGFDRYFPEVVESLSRMPITDAVVRASIVVADAQGIDFAAVRRRLHPSERLAVAFAAASPATLVLTDVSRRGHDDLRRAPLDERRRELERLGEDLGLAIAPANLRRLVPATPAVVTPQTVDRAVARAWWLDHDATGRDGVIARHLDGRRWRRVRHVRTSSCVVTGYRASDAGAVSSVRLGLYDADGSLLDVGRTMAFRRAPIRRAAAAALAVVAPNAGTVTGPEWVEVLPALVCEVSFERLRGARFRNAVTFVRWLPEADPSSCTIAQLHA